MALVDCRECENKISDKAKSCPHCGAPLEGNITTAFDPSGRQSYTDGERKVGALLWVGILILPIVFFWLLLRKGYSTSIRVWGFIYLLISIFVLPGILFPENQGNNVKRPYNDASESRMEDDNSHAEAMTPISASLIADAYEENSVSADSRFKGKQLLVDGIVYQISTNVNGQAYVTFDTKNIFNAPIATFIDSEKDRLAELKKGQHIKASCIGNGDVLKSPLLDDCTLAD